MYFFLFEQALQRRSKNNHCRCYALCSFCPALRDFVTQTAALNLIKKTKNWRRGTEKPGNFEMAEPIQGRTGGNGHREFRQIGFALGLRKQLFHFAYWLNQ